MQHRTCNTLFVAILAFGSLSTTAQAGALTIGDETTDKGALTLSGFLRAKYQDKSWSDNDHKLTFDAAKVNLDYKSPKFFGHIEYRCYQFDKLCDFSSLVDGYVGYNINKTDNLTLGLQPVPFGPSRFWESNWYGGIVTQFGLEDVHNLGVKYHFQPFNATDVDLAYFAKDGGKYGSSSDASRYTANYVESLDEKNMWIARISKDLKLSEDGKLNAKVGGSYWYSDIDNKVNNLTGDRKAWALFSTISYDNLALTLTGGKNKVNNKDTTSPDISTMGSFKDYYDVANKGTFYTADVSYAFKNVGNIGTITPYAMYSTYKKDTEGFKDSTRSILGVSVDHKQLTFVAEYIMGKNDFNIGGTSASYGAGDDNGNNHLLNLQVLYNF
ncbi:hypothetical protein F4V57_02575 [Acinetobacter qingfengensis]|uniref:Porin n=1 Tax=Acinetobacter qingfengensis TaxID=1262585 RepID=A0A1E7RER8_9GAMM|nr:hypothetical protein [Acinetobacter qingfengensis]KAA8735696.1 hypothetical protein F4V57_02575 [Acinetobacter qingfengensis]OEY97858.1 hypothetical protein BJI46_07245 [Acinetobacter qingfengensis]